MLKKKKYAKNVQEDQGPDWGGLKHVEREEGDSDEGPKKVMKCLINAKVTCIILYILYY